MGGFDSIGIRKLQQRHSAVTNLSLQQIIDNDAENIYGYQAENNMLRYLMLCKEATGTFLWETRGEDGGRGSSSSLCISCYSGTAGIHSVKRHKAHQ